MTAPVFVDASGRRARWLRGVCWALSSVLLGYVVLVVAALVAPPDVLSLRVPGLGPVLPGDGAPAITSPDGGDAAPAEVVATLPTPRARPSSAATPARGAPATRPSAAPRGTGQPSPAPVGAPTTTPRPGPTVTPTAVPGRASGRPTARPTPRASKSRPPHP